MKQKVERVVGTGWNSIIFNNEIVKGGWTIKDIKTATCNGVDVAWFLLEKEDEDNG